MNIKVYRMDEYEWWASTWSEEDTNKFFNEFYGTDNSVEDIEECNLEEIGMWIETTDKEDIEKLGEASELVSVIDSDKKIKDIEYGALRRRYGAVWKYISLKEALKKYKEEDFKEPFCIASMEC